MRWGVAWPQKDPAGSGPLLRFGGSLDLESLCATSPLLSPSFLACPGPRLSGERAVSESAITFVVLGVGVVVVLFVWNRFPPEIVALGAAIALYAAGVLDPHQVFAGFGDPVVPFLAGLFVISEGLDASGVTGWAGQQLISGAGTRSRLVVALLAFVAILSALITPNGAVAALVPMAVLVALRIRRPPSQLLMPLAFAASAGS